MRNKNSIRKNAGNYHEWLEKREGYDSSSLENLCGASSPYNLKLVPPILDDAYEMLERLYYDGHLKGRQYQIVTLLFDGFTSQTDIAKQLNMKQSNVAVELRKIMKKIYGKII